MPYQRDPYRDPLRPTIPIGPQSALPQNRTGSYLAKRLRAEAAGDRLADLAGADPYMQPVGELSRGPLDPMQAEQMQRNAGRGLPRAGEQLSGIAAAPSDPIGGGLPAPDGIADHRPSLPQSDDYRARVLQALRMQLDEARARGDTGAEMAIMEKIAEVSGTPPAPGASGSGGFTQYGADPALSSPQYMPPEAPRISRPPQPMQPGAGAIEQNIVEPAPGAGSQTAGMLRARDDRAAAFDDAFRSRMADANQRRPETEFGQFAPGGGTMGAGLSGLGRARAQSAIAQGDRGVIGSALDRIADTAPGSPGAARYVDRVFAGDPAGDTSGFGGMSMDPAGAVSPAVEPPPTAGLASVPPTPAPRPPRQQMAASTTATPAAGLSGLQQTPPLPTSRPDPQPPTGDTAGFGDMLMDDPEQNRDDTQRMAKSMSSVGEDAPDVPEWALPLLAAGLGMMASNNPSGMAAVGEGGLAGLKSWLGMKERADKRRERLEDVRYREDKMAQDERLSREQIDSRERLAEAERESMAPYRQSQIDANRALARYRESGGAAAGGTSKAVVDAQRLNKLAEDYALNELGLARVPDQTLDPEAARSFAIVKRRNLDTLHQQYGIPQHMGASTSATPPPPPPGFVMEQ